MEINVQPPQDIDAEQALIAAIFTYDIIPEDVFDLLSPNDFYRTAHQEIFRVCNDLHSEKMNIDLISVNDVLRKNSKMIEVTGGASYLTKIIDTVPLSINPAQTARLIRDKSILREILVKSIKTIEACCSNGAPEQILDEAQNNFLKIEPVFSGNGYSQVGDLVAPAIDRFENLNRTGEVPGVPTGYYDLDRLTGGFQKTDMVIIAGRPSMGKTAFALNCAGQMAQKNIPGAFFSLEMSKEQLVSRMFSMESGLDSAKFRFGSFLKSDWPFVLKAGENLHKWPLFIDDTPSLSAHELKRKVRQLKKRENIQYVFVDYLQLMEGQNKYGSREAEISSISRTLKLIAKDFDLPVIALSQLNRDLEKRADKRPMLSDLRESGAIEQDADVVVFIYRDEVYNDDTLEPGIAELNVAKQRSGPTGTVRSKWSSAQTKFFNLSYDEEIQISVQNRY